MAEHTVTREEFARWVREVLNRLYDPSYLQSHPLAEAMAGPDVSALHRSQNLRRILLNAIRALRSESSSPSQGNDRRAARILTLRFVEDLSPAEVMQQLSYGRSQFFHEQARMIDLLTTICWEQYQKNHVPEPESREQQEDTPVDPVDASREQLARTEVNRLLASATWESVNLTQLIQQLHAMIDPLAQTKGVTVSIHLKEALEVARGDRVLLRQVALNVVTYAFDLAPGGQVEIGVLNSALAIGVVIQAHGQLKMASHDQSQRLGIGLEVSRQLMRAMHGTLEITSNKNNLWQARLSWPVATSQTLLVVDDNKGFIDLFQRYLSGHNWQVIGAGNSEDARKAIREQQPAVIILDVMMPKEDGWEFLVALRADAVTRDIPVIICSVLNEPQMAQALGANGYLLKPVTQQAMLQALEPWLIAHANPALTR